MAHVPSTLPRGSGERESAIFQAAGAVAGSSRPAPESGKRSPLRSSPGSGSATKSPGARPVRPCLAAMRDELTAALQARWEKSLADEATDGGDGVGEAEEGVDDFLAALVAALQPVGPAGAVCTPGPA